MKWHKIGKIFDPSQHALPNGCESFAQSPQALVCDDHVRIYFSTRARDASGKFLSHVAYVDMDRGLERILRVADHTVLPLGELGAFDEHGIFPINPVRHGDRVLAYTTGWNRRVSVSVDTAIGLAVSTDGGRTFAREGAGPVLAQSLHEPCLVGDGFVQVIEGVFHMWYIFGTGWKRYSPDAAPDRTYKIGHATSGDGVHWTKEEARQIVANRLGPDESQALPTVTEIDGRHHMFFCYRQSSDFRTNSGRGYRIGHAWSDDLHNWTRDDDQIPLAAEPGAWDGDMQCYPHVFKVDDRICLLYNGNEFGRHGFGLALLER
ncbi:hypothetical protein SOM61_07235 [Massilia sp. CFBP9012]|uniref:hypothetical protein n=1 Tax=Massilia sp. CFBP9012 TaxID=3096531 RepID=UPI002A6A33E3|nr:hypothetical protein [Massilia sp. CFBP9012]MDY0974751.1 hypothetical protein [Massilia sp. CFBP9012]